MKKLFFVSALCLATLAMNAQYPTRVYLCGPASPSATAGSEWLTEHDPMYTYVEDDGQTPTGVYEMVADLKSGDLKFLYGSSWEPGYRPTTDQETLSIGSHTILDRPDGSYPDNKWAVSAGRYKLVLNLSDSTLTVSDGTGLEDKNGNGQSFKPAIPVAVFAVGDGTAFGWTPSSSDSIFQITEGVFDGVVFLKSGEFKLMHQQDWGAQYGPVENGESITGAGTYSLCKPADDNKWKVAETITELTPFHMIADVNAGTLVLRDTSVVIPPCTTLYMLGDAVGGWSFDDNAIELTSEDSVFTYEGDLYDGEFKFFEKKDFGAQAWGATASGTPVTGSGDFDLVRLTEDNKFYMTAGHYQLTANLKEGKMTVVYSLTDLENVRLNKKATKQIQNNQIIIIRDAKRYSVLGTEL